MYIPKPSELGFISKFKAWRPQQLEFIEDLLTCRKQFVGRSVRPGFGKTACYMAYAKIAEKEFPRVMILTGTKGLATQLLDEFYSLGVREIRGKGSYNCSQLPGKSCEEGSIGKCCFRGSPSCAYKGAKDEATNANFVVTNYACWIAANKYSTGFGDFDLLILDEAHTAGSWLDKAMRIQLSDHEMQMLKFSWPLDVDGIMQLPHADAMVEWKEWAGRALSRATQHFQQLEERMSKMQKPSSSLIAEFRHAQNLQRKLTDLASTACRPEKWVPESSNWGYQFDPINAGEFAHKYLFCGVGKVLAVSGTCRPKTLEMMGIGPDDYDFREYSGPADPSRSPLVHVPTVRVWHGSQEWELKRLVKRIDETIEIWGLYRGLIQTANYKLRDFIMRESQYLKYMITNYAENGDITAEIVRRFKETEPPIILVSPSIHTGYDFLGDAARWNVIAKIQFPDDRSKIEQARKREDPERNAYFALQYLMQAHGRPNRGDDDWSMTLVYDDSVENLIRRYGHLAPAALHSYYKEQKSIPFPLEDGPHA